MAGVLETALLVIAQKQIVPAIQTGNQVISVKLLDFGKAKKAWIDGAMITARIIVPKIHVCLCLIEVFDRNA